MAKTKIKEAIESSLSESICMELGIMPLAVKGNVVEIGAMNPSFPKLIEYIETIQSSHEIQTKIVFVDADVWEKWYDQDEKSRFNHLLTKSSEQEEEITESYTTEKDIDTLDTKTEEQEPINQPVVDNQLESSFIENEEDELDLIIESSLSSTLDSTEEEQEEEIGLEDGQSALKSKDFVVNSIAKILKASSVYDASDIHIEPQQDRLRIRYRIDGILTEKYSLNKSNIAGITARCKVLSRLDVAEKRIPQDGRLRVSFDSEILDFRVSTLPGKYGEKIVMRALRSDNSILNLGKLVSSTNELNKIRSLCSAPYGIFIVVGPTGSGKSTSLYSILSEHNEPTVNISTVEDPIEYTLPGLHQVQVLREKGLDFSRALRALMRQDPDIILVGETRDKETAQVAMEAALTGHMVFTTLHANDSATAVTRLSEMGVPPFLIGASVVGVLAQRLVRALCQSCKIESADISHPLFIKHNIKQHYVPNIVDETTNSKKGTCPVCNGSGYKGRVGIYEVLEITDNIRSHILEGSNAEQIREAAIKQNNRTLLDYGMWLVSEGLTSMSEVERVCTIDDGFVEDMP